MTPRGWPSLVLDRFSSDPSLMCLLLRDHADPGYPSFPVLRSEHLAVFGRLLPQIFVNQGRTDAELTEPTIVSIKCTWGENACLISPHMHEIMQPDSIRFRWGPFSRRVVSQSGRTGHLHCCPSVEQGETHRFGPGDGHIS